MIRLKIIFEILVFFLLILLVNSNSALSYQAESRGDNVTVNRNKMVLDILKKQDNLFSYFRKTKDSIVIQSNQNLETTITTLKIYSDSVSNASRDSLDKKRIDSLNLKTTLLSKTFSNILNYLILEADKESEKAINELINLKDSSFVCDSCEDLKDFNDNFMDYKVNSDSIIIDFKNNLHSIVESYQDTLSTLLDKASDEISEYNDKLIENRTEELEMLKDRQEEISDSLENAYENASRLTFSLGYDSHVIYRGRDNGLDQYGYSPEIKFSHKSGISINFDSYFLSKTNHVVDEADLGISYSHEFSDIFSTEIGYSYLWFNTNSFQARSEMNNSLDVGCTLDLFGLNINPNIIFDFGKVREWSLLWEFSYPINFKNVLVSRQIKFEPALRWNLGEQNGQATTRRLKKVKNKIVQITNTKNISLTGVMDYEFSIPFKIDFGAIMVSSMINFIIPLNVVDASSSKPFAEFILQLEYSIR